MDISLTKSQGTDEVSTLILVMSLQRKNRNGSAGVDVTWSNEIKVASSFRGRGSKDPFGKLKKVTAIQPVGRRFITFLIQKAKGNFLRRKINNGRPPPM